MNRILSAVFLISIFSCIARNVSSIETQIIRSNCPDEADKWPCRSGACILVNEVCDGIKHCRDSSDENEQVCRDTQCAALSFRCAYGACISIDRICDGVDDCLDSSDEDRAMCLQRRLQDKFGEEALRKKCAGFGQMKCWSGQCVRIMDKCNGIVDCADESDEWPNLCAKVECDKSTQFKCKYGACIDLSAKCNGTVECLDKSDEDVGFCGLANKSHKSDDISTTTTVDKTEEQTTITTTKSTTRKVFKYPHLQYYNKYEKSRYCPYQWIDDNTDCCTLNRSKVKCRDILPYTIVHKGCQFGPRKCFHQCTEERKWIKIS